MTGCDTKAPFNLVWQEDLVYRVSMIAAFGFK
jgi:hypothetical protein